MNQSLDIVDRVNGRLYDLELEVLPTVRHAGLFGIIVSIVTGLLTTLVHSLL